MRYDIYEITGQYAIAPNNGQELYDQILPRLSAGESIELNFSNVNIFATAFFNVAMGQLLKDLSRSDLNRQIQITGLSSDGQNILRRVMDNSERYYTQPSYRQAVDSVMEEYVANC
jgi:STAS-like domain of unknown function (DUF4325)